MNGDLLAPIGYILSAMALIAVVLIAIDVVSRDDFPGLEHGRGAVAGGAIRWVWLVLIVLSLGMGLNPS